MRVLAFTTAPSVGRHGPGLLHYHAWEGAAIALHCGWVCLALRLPTGAGGSARDALGFLTVAVTHDWNEDYDCRAPTTQEVQDSFHDDEGDDSLLRLLESVQWRPV